MAKKQGAPLQCPACGSNHINVQIVADGAQTNKKGIGFGGHVNNAARGLTAICTLGASNLVWKKSKGTDKTDIKNTKVAICQNCGSSWEVGKSKGFGSAPKSIIR